MARVAIRKEDLDRVVQVAQRTAKRTNERVIVAHERVDIQDSDEDKIGCRGPDNDQEMVNFG
jgi:hypothetical protein